MEEASAAPKSASTTYALELASSEEVEHLVAHQAQYPHKPQWMAYDTPHLLPKHKIFISHSGIQKDFAEQLCVDLESHGYYPFFDKRDDSLPKGKKFPPLIIEAARQCLFAIVLISEDFFTKTKWPMLELAIFVKEQKTRKELYILPVLLGLSIEDLQNTEKWSKTWIKWVSKDPRLTDNVIIEWKDAIRALRPVNMLLKSKYDGEVKLRKDIVKCINGVMPPDIRSDVLHVQGRERLCKKVRSMFDEVPSMARICKNAKVLGVYGIGGVGKSALCMIVTEYLRSEFLGKACVVELGKETCIANLQRVLRRLCTYTKDFIDQHISTEKECISSLRERICRERVFLALDNVSDDASINTAKSFLSLEFHPNSMVLVTSRAYDVLCSSLGIPVGNCTHCPSITKDEALQILLEQVNLPLELLDTEQVQVLHHAVELSFFEGTYHPLALQLFSAQLGADQSKWREIKLDLQWTSDLEHPLFSKIETNYMRLPDQHTKDMFMDIALFTPECLCGIDDIKRWLNDTIKIDGDVDQKLKILRVKSLLELWKTGDKTFRIHDLYRMLAERNASVDNVVPKFIYQMGAIVAPKVLLDNDRAKIVERAAFVEAKFEILWLEACTKLQVLSARRCEKLRELCIQRLGYLVSLELVVCPLESLDLSGSSNLRWLHVSDCKDLMKLDASEVKGLRHVNVSKCSKLKDLNFKNCPMMKSVSILYSDILRRVNLGSGENLECLTLWFCGSLTDVEISGVAHLSTLKKRGCPQLLALQGGDITSRDLQYVSLDKWGKISSTFVRALEISRSLQVLDIWHSCISWLPDLKTCVHLQELRLHDVDVLLESKTEKLLQDYEEFLRISAAAMQLPKSLEDIRIVSCRNVAIKEIFWKVHGLTNLRLLLLSEVRVGWDWELYRMRSIFDDALKDEIDVMHQQLSKGLSVTGHGEMQDEVSLTGCLNETIHWIQVFLKGKESLSELEHSIKAELQRWKTGAEHPTLQQDFGWMFWSSMTKAVEIRRSPCWVVEQIIHETCNNFDSLCERLQQVLSKDWPQGDKISRIMELCRKVHVYEICGQLFYLTAKRVTDIAILYHELEIWERTIIEEVLARGTSTCTLLVPRLRRLVNILAFLCRDMVVNWVELKEQELTQYAWDWLWACRVCLSLEQLKGCLAKQAVQDSCQLEMDRHRVQELLRHFDEMFIIEVKRLSIDALVSDKGCGLESIDTFDGHDRFGGLIWCWKVRQWLQEVESCLSVHLMQEEKPQESLSVSEVWQSIIEIERQLHMLAENYTPIWREKTKGVDRSMFVENLTLLQREARMLVTQMSEEWSEWSDTDSLDTVLGVKSNTEKGIIMDAVDLFFKHIRSDLIPFLELTAEVEWVSGWTENLLALMSSVDMQQWQWRSIQPYSLNGGELSAMIDGGGHAVKKEKQASVQTYALNKRLPVGGSSSKEPNEVEEEPDWKLHREEQQLGLEADWKLEMERLRRLVQAPSSHFLEWWDDVNSNQVLSLPISQCTRLRSLYISNCRFTDLMNKLSDQWTLCKHRKRYLGSYHFCPLDCPP